MFSPLGHGFLTGALKKPSDLPEGDLRRYLARFQEEVRSASSSKRTTAYLIGSQSFEHNLAIVEKLAAVARKKGITPAQLSLAWVCSRGDHVIPIPGSTA